MRTILVLIVGCYLATVTTATATVAARTLQRQNVKGASCGIGRKCQQSK